MSMPENQLTRDVPPWEDREKKQTFIDALRRGDTEGVIAAFYGRTDAVIDPGTRRMADYILELRRQNVSVIGASDVFVRRTAAGQLQQVIQGVKLSLDDDSLYQIPDRWEKRLRRDLNVLWRYNKHKDEPYTMVPIIDEPHKAHVSAEGYHRMNAVAGCSVALPPSVVVDGKPVSNPYILRDQNNDVKRIVIRTVVAGPAPTTGNLVLVDYMLDLDPRIDLLHMLAGVLRGFSKPRYGEQRTDDDDDNEQEQRKGAVQLMTRQAFNEFRVELDEEDRLAGGKGNVGRRWAWEQLTGDVGYAHDLTNREVQNVYSKFLDLLQNAIKKAQTVARRNAMKSHPALARQHVHIGKGRDATIAVVGWTGHEVDLSRYTEALDKVARGERAPGVEVIVAGEDYNPDEHKTGEAEIDVPDHVDEAPTAFDVDAEKRSVRAAIDELLVSMPVEKLRTAGYADPGPNATLDTLNAILEHLRSLT